MSEKVPYDYSGDFLLPVHVLDKMIELLNLDKTQNYQELTITIKADQFVTVNAKIICRKEIK